MSSQNADTSLPAVVPPVGLSPDVGNVSTVFVLTLSASEALPVAPEVYFVDGPVRYDFSFTGQQDAIYTYEYQPLGVETQTRHLISARMTDAAQNAFEGPLGVEISFDFDPPTIDSPVVALVPAQTSPLHVADRFLSASPIAGLRDATLETQVLFDFTSGEPLDDPAGQTRVELLLGSSTQSFPLVLASVAGRRFSFGRTVDAAMSEGNYDLEAHVTDRAGNRTVLRLPAAVSIDFQPPAAASVTIPDAVVYRRTPWGSIATGGKPEFTVEGVSGAVQSSSYVFFYDAPSAGSVLSVTRADSQGAFSALLPPNDRGTVFVAVVDAAGNSSATDLVREVAWTATLGGKVAGSVVENPNVFVDSPRFGARVEQPGAIEAGAAQGLDTIDCNPTCPSQGTVSTQGLGHWRAPEAIASKEVFPPRFFVPLQDMAIAYDPNKGEILAMGGGVLGSGVTNATWAFDGHEWRLVSENQGPVPRFGARMAYDENLHKMVLFGGQYELGGTACPSAVSFTCNDTWAWDGAAWSQLTTNGGPPPHRANHAMLFDRQRDRLTVSGGNMLITHRSDTWELNCNLAPCQWTQVNGSAFSPARTKLAMSYDEPNQRLMLFGGEGDAVPCYDTGCADLWQLKGGVWSKLADDAGIHRRGHSLVYDPTRNESLVWGIDPLYQFQSDPVTCGRPWSLVGTSFTCPPAASVYELDQTERANSYSAYFPSSQEVVVFGYEEGGQMRRWQGGASDRPVHVLHAALGMALGGQNASVAKVSFQPASAPAPFGYAVDTGSIFAAHADGQQYGWVDDPVGCQNVACTAGACPPSVDNNDPSAPGQEYDTYIQMLDMEQVTKKYDCTWEYALPNGQYSVAAVLGDSQAPDSPVSVDIEGTVFEGRTSISWPWAEAVVRVDVTDGRLTIGSARDVENKIAFINIFRATTVDEVSVNWNAGADANKYDPARELLVYAQSSCAAPAGPINLSFHSSDTPQWPAIDDLDVLVGADPRRRFELVVVSHDGNTYSGTFVKWCLSFDGEAVGPFCSSPSVTLTAGQGRADVMDLTSATLGPIAGLGLTVQLDGASYPFCNNGVSIKLRTAALPGSPRSGATLYSFASGQWQPLIVGTASSAQPQALTWVSASPAEASLLAFGPSRELAFAVAPSGANGMLVDGARVVSDYVEVMVRYHVEP